MLQEIKRQGTLNVTILPTQTQGGQPDATVGKAGLCYHEAWEIVKDDVLFPTEERRAEILKTRLLIISILQ